MAKVQRVIRAPFGSLLSRIEEGVLSGSSSASLEDRCDYCDGDARCSVRVFERYSWSGGNRVSMCVTLFQVGDGPIRVCAITSGGSQAMFLKINTFGEESFLATLEDVLDEL